MRWEQLFADLEARVAEDGARAELAEAASRARAETGRVAWLDRVRGATGQQVVLGCGRAGDVPGRVLDVGVDWVLLADARQREVLVAAGSVRSVAGLGTLTAEPADDGVVARALDLRRAVRGLARDRAALLCRLDDGTALTGTVDRVGADFLELAEHPLDEPRRRGAVRSVRLVVLASVAVLVSTVPALD